MKKNLKYNSFQFTFFSTRTDEVHVQLQSSPNETDEETLARGREIAKTHIENFGDISGRCDLLCQFGGVTDVNILHYDTILLSEEGEHTSYDLPEFFIMQHINKAALFYVDKKSQLFENDKFNSLWDTFKKLAVWESNCGETHTGFEFPFVFTLDGIRAIFEKITGLKIQIL
jgi:hypothetical protein